MRTMMRATMRSTMRSTMRARMRSSTRVAAAAALMWISALGCVRAMHNPEHGASDVLTEDEIARVSVVSAFDAVQRLRPQFLSYRGETSLLNTSSPEPTVYLDGVRYGELATLRGIPAADVATITLYRAWASATRFGTGNMGGVIEVTTKH